MNDKLKDYLVNICQLYGFAFSIPMGQFFLNFVFEEKVNMAAFVLSIISLLFGIIVLFLGGIINVNGKNRTT